ncbi:MAG: DUF2149 domain-containing protein [Thermodesulfobacteriaceae bacterium]|nr:DUF2149 domain-containing protein [Caldimicrobium sp.]MCX8041499.1 DUF2149 domain-containing protein [Thermodesulfobacteriaceae bacterium]MDW8135471.1 DUF2149 domain-containing protein [Thermodesulfobacterium sp.]
MKKFLKREKAYKRTSLEDPLSGVANLFDISVVFIVCLIIALFTAYNLLELLNPKSEFTLVKKTPPGEIEIITKKGVEIKAQKITNKTLFGEGKKLGTAYQLKDGTVIYVPE